MTMYCIYAEYIHCLGKTVHPVAAAETEAEALSWIESRDNDPSIPRPPKKDPSAFCKVTHCPLKIQRPRYFYRWSENGCLDVEN